MADDGHETVDSVVTPAGGVESDHVVPPFWVTMTEATLPPSSPTATQVAELAVALGAQETALTLARGVYPAVARHVGVTAAEAAGIGESRVPRTPIRAEANTVDSAMTPIPRTVRTATSRQDAEHTK